MVMGSVNFARFVHTQPAVIYHPTGLMLDRDFMPAENATNLLVNHLLHNIFVEDNPRTDHKCSQLCCRPTQILLGFPHAEDVKSSCPPECAAIIEQYERLVSLAIYDEGEDVTINTIIIEFLPCNKIVEILAVGIYL